MKKTETVILLALALLWVLAPLCFAEEAAPEKGSNIFYYAMAALGCGIGIGLGAIGSGIGMGIGTSKACEGIARNPGTTGKITTTLIIGLALMESLTIYALVVILIILFVNPFGKLLH
ncbi:MAG: ATP synthase F0 subunit C [Thermodesulfovibrionales bacterium]|nr:ATP synthase F0 subunit C [Thermodesulfovibrionales bacterium]